MVGIDRRAVVFGSGVETSIFDLALYAVVAIEAETLQSAKPELHRIALVRLNMIGGRCCDGHTFMLEAERAPRLTL